jgi:PKD repeat protein
VTVAPAPTSAPAITSVLTATGQVGAAFSYQITASNSPTSYGAVGLPAGLSINTVTGLISGTPTASGGSSVTLSATNAGGTGTKTLTLTINPSAPVISPCDLNGDGVVDSVDVGLAVDQSKGRLPCTNGDLTLDGRCNVQDVQRVSNAASGGICKVGKK